jgi:hypothetical protein
MLKLSHLANGDEIALWLDVENIGVGFVGYLQAGGTTATTPLLAVQNRGQSLSHSAFPNPWRPKK